MAEFILKALVRAKDLEGCEDQIAFGALND